MTRISVPIPVYNGAKYLPTQLDSILKQLSDDDEVIISYNPSTDNTWDIIKDYEAKYPIVHVYRCDEMGLLPNLENALKKSNGRYIFLSDQDDCWLDNKVNIVLQTFRDTNATMVVHDMRYADGNLIPTENTMFAERHSGNGLLKNFIKNSYHGGCMAFEARYLDIFLPIPANIGYHDSWFGFLTELFGKPVFISDILLLYRRHEDNLSARTKRKLSVIIPERLRQVKELYKRHANIKFASKYRNV